MTDQLLRPGLPAPTAPRVSRARWNDGRFLLGLALVLASVLAGARVVAAAGDTAEAWAATRDLPAGVTLTAEDLQPVAVNLSGAAERYVGISGESPSGRVLSRPLTAGELLPVAALQADAGDRRLVTLPVDPLHLPPGLIRGERVDVFVTPGGDRDAAAPPRLVLAAASVAEVSQASSGLGSGQVGVVVEVDAAQAGPTVEALRSGPVDLVRIP